MMRALVGTHSLTGGDLEDLGGKADGALDTELLVLGTVDQVIGDFQTTALAPLCHHSIIYQILTLLQVRNVAAGERDTDLVYFGGGDGGAGSVVVLFSLGDVTHPDICWRVRW